MAHGKLLKNGGQRQRYAFTIRWQGGFESLCFPSLLGGEVGTAPVGWGEDNAQAGPAPVLRIAHSSKPIFHYIHTYTYPYTH